MNNQKGLTLVEVLVALTTMSVLIVVLVAFLVNYWSFSMYQQADLDSMVERLNASDYVRENIGSSTGLITQNSIVDANVGYQDPLYGSGTYWFPIHAVPSVIAKDQNGAISPVIYYKRLSTNPSNQLLYNGSQPYEDEFIMYIDSASRELRVRTLVNPNTTATNKLKTTCPPQSASAACPKDTTLISGVQSVEKRFFSRSGNTIDWTSVYDPLINEFIGPDNAAVEVVELKVNVSKRATFQKSDTTNNATIIRVALRNT